MEVYQIRAAKNPMKMYIKKSLIVFAHNCQEN